MRTSKFILVVVCMMPVLFWGNVRSIRLCGTRLADTLNSICEQFGGFHTPQKRSDSRDLSSNIAHAIFRRTLDETTATTDEESSIASSGVVNECCRKECTINTLISYCSQTHLAGTSDISEALSTLEAQLNNSDDDGEILSNLTLESLISSSQVSTDDTTDASGNRQNLGIFRRNQPVFIVLSQPEEESSSNLEEYRF